MQTEKTIFLLKFAPNLLLFCIFKAFQHKNAGQNIQQLPEKSNQRLKVGLLFKIRDCSML